MTTRERLILATCCMSLFIGGMDATIVNLGLPAIRTDLHGSLTDLQWVIDVYTLGIASLQMVSGPAGDRIGRKRVFQTGLIVFATASLLCGLAPNLTCLIAFRGLQAVGASMMNPLAISIITSVFTDPGQRARAIGIWSAVFGVSLAIGPCIGGLLIGAVGWRSIFWINIPLVLAALLLTVLYVPESRAAQPRRVDPVGQFLAGALIGGLTFAIIEAPRTGWTSTRVDTAAVVALIAGTVFVRYELRHREPAVDLRYFRRPRFSGAILIAVLSNGGFYGFLFLVSLYLQQVQGRSPVSAGLVILPMGVATAVFATLTGRLITRIGPRRPLVWSGVLLSGGAALMVLAVAHDSPFVLMVSLVTVASGFGFVNAPVTYIAAAEIPGERAGLAGAMTSTSRFIGSSLGVAVVGSILAERLSGPLASGFVTAGLPCWWVIAGCGFGVLVISLVPSARAPAAGRRRAVEIAATSGS